MSNESNEINKSGENNYNPKGSKQDVLLKVGNIVTIAYFLAMMVVYPFFVRDGYYEIGEMKYYFFRNASIIITVVMVIVTVIRFFSRRKKHFITELYKSLSVTDWFVYAYFITALISYLLTPFTYDALQGAEGWYMGLVSQLLFVSIYFVFSRYFRWDEKALYAVFVSSALVFLLGILNRYSIYPINMEGQTPGFIATLGNINWFCGYWAVICPLGIVFYYIGNCDSVHLCSENGWRHVAAGIYVVIGFIIGVIQGSSSAYLVFAGIFIFLFALAFQNNQSMSRLLQLCVLFSLSCQLARLFRYLPGFNMNYENELGILLTDTNATLYMGVVMLALLLLFTYMEKQKGYKIEQYKNIRNIVLILFAVIMFVYVIVLAVNSFLPEGIPGLSGIGFLTFNDEWASYRGATWSIGMRAYNSMAPLYKLIGAGPDCFAEYIYLVPEIAEYAYAQFGDARLTNAHNEWLTLLVNQGMLGLISYAGIFITAFVRFMKKAKIQPALYLCAASVLLYTVHNMVSFQQVLNAPFVFIILGIGEGLCRKNEKEAAGK